MSGLIDSELVGKAKQLLAAMDHHAKHGESEGARWKASIAADGLDEVILDMEWMERIYTIQDKTGCELPGSLIKWREDVFFKFNAIKKVARDLGIII